MTARAALCGKGVTPILIALVCAIAPAAAQAQAPGAISPADIDNTVASAMSAFSIPGVAIGVVKDGKLIFAKGYGVRELGKPDKVDADTLFAIGSNTKAFTAAALAILVDEGKIRWDDKVIDHLPDFRLADPYVTREFTIRDLLTHRSGLGPGQGDLLFYPSTDFTREDVIRALRHLKPVSSFRSEFAYDNLLYMVAGQIVPAVTGQSWEDFVQTRILVKLGMDGCAVNLGRIRDRSDIASPHALVEGVLKPVPADDITLIGPAGTIQCNVNGMAKWVETQLGEGKSPSGAQLFSADRSHEMWTPQTIVPASPIGQLTRTHMTAYGLGWGLQDFNGYLRVNHAGGVTGMVTHVNMLPELNLGVIVLTNQQNMPGMNAISLTILNAYAGAPARDWVGMMKSVSDRMAQGGREADAKAAAVLARNDAKPALPLDAYAGVYHDAWRGDATVRSQGGRLVLKFSHTERLEGVLSPYAGDMFIVRWNDRSLNADAYVRFTQDFDGKVAGMTLRAVSPTTDFSFDFQDLDFKRTGEQPAG